MSLKWLNDRTYSEAELHEYSYWADPKPQSDSNWDTSVFIYKPKPGCRECDEPALTLNFRFEVTIKKIYTCDPLNVFCFP